MTSGLRRWQSEALAQFHRVGEPGDFLVTATPGAGKTTFALTFAKFFLDARRVDRVIVVVPTDHLRAQWSYAALRFDMVLDPTLGNDTPRLSPDLTGYVATYAQIAANPGLHRWRCESTRTLVILDEVHHAGDGFTWGEGIQEAFNPAKQRLSLTGTPFRSKGEETIPFVRYQETPDGIESEADYTYSYAEALKDGVVRPVMFAAYSGTTSWRNSAGDVLSTSLSGTATKDEELTAWRTALDPRGQWVPHVIRATFDRLMNIRQRVPDATALILASNQESAKAYAEIAEAITGEPVALILSEDPQASLRLAEFAAGSHKMAVCVRMISEGVDIPSASVLAWLTSYRTPLFFAQAVGRVLRARKPHEVATVFLPAVRPLLALAADMEVSRNHVITFKTVGSEDELDLLQDGLDHNPSLDANASQFEALTSDAEFAHILYEGRAVTAGLSDEEQEYVGIPGLLTAEQTAALLQAREAEIKANLAGRISAPPPLDMLQTISETRRELNRLVAHYSFRKGVPHAHIHTLLKREVPGPPASSAPLAVLEKRRDYLRKLANRP